MSEAALAMEKLNNTPIKGHTGVYKVYIAKRLAFLGNKINKKKMYPKIFGLFI